ncbi:MAG: hypothetical protein ACJ07L_11935 [Opitutales bacterium]
MKRSATEIKRGASFFAIVHGYHAVAQSKAPSYCFLLGQYRCVLELGA